MQHLAMHKSGLCRHALSVCLSVTFMYSVKTSENIFDIYSPSGTHTVADPPPFSTV